MTILGDRYYYYSILWMRKPRQAVGKQLAQDHIPSKYQSLDLNSSLPDTTSNTLAQWVQLSP